MAGYVMLSEGRQKWAKYWFQLKNDCVLYRFKAHEVCACVCVCLCVHVCVCVCMFSFKGTWH